MKTFCKIILLIVFIATVIVFINIIHYFKIQNDNEIYTDICIKQNERFTTLDDDSSIGVINNPNSCFCRMYTRMLPRLLVHKVKNDNKELNFIRPSRETCIIPTIALEKADAFISYKVNDNTELEYVITELYKKNLYTYNCGIKEITHKNEHLIFDNECIETDEYITRMGRKSSGKIHTFDKKLKELKLDDKKIFLKMDIIGYEVDILPQIIKHHKNLTGIAIDLMLNDSTQVIKYEKLLKDMENNFVLVARNEGPLKKHCDCDFKNKYISSVLSLTYINKELIDKNSIPFKQSYNSKKDYKQLYFSGFCLSKFDISWKLILSEKIKLLFGES